MTDTLKGLTAQNILMSLLHYEGREYYTAHFIHQQYRLNNPDGKYRLLGDFTRLIRSIHAYPFYVELGHIVELEWKSLKNKSDAEFSLLQSAFKANVYRPIMLISPTGQASLFHHLDDEISKQHSVSINSMAAQQAQEAALPKPETQNALHELPKPEPEPAKLDAQARIAEMELQFKFLKETAGLRQSTDAATLGLLKNLAANLGVPANLVPQASAAAPGVRLAPDADPLVVPLALLAVLLPQWADAEDKHYWYFKRESIEMVCEDYNILATLRDLRDKELLIAKPRKLTIDNNPKGKRVPGAVRLYAVKKFTLDGGPQA